MTGGSLVNSIGIDKSPDSVEYSRGFRSTARSKLPKSGLYSQSPRTGLNGTQNWLHPECSESRSLIHSTVLRQRSFPAGGGNPCASSRSSLAMVALQ